MKCKVCKGAAVVQVPRHNANFCPLHYKEHIHYQVERVIKSYRMFSKKDRILLGVSGGKDSMVLWNVLRELGYSVQTVHINVRQGDYFEKSEAVVRKFAEETGADLKVYRFRDIFGFEFESALKFSRKPVCSLCGTLKRHAFNRLAKGLNCDVCATAHNLDDETALLLGNVLHWQMGYLRRQSPVLEAETGMVKKVKPAVRITDREMKDYADLFSIGYVDEKCPYSRGATTHFYKDILNRLEDQYPGTKTYFYFKFIKDLKPSLKEASEDTGDVNHCVRCGCKTLQDGKCFVCALADRIKMSAAGQEAVDP